MTFLLALLLLAPQEDAKSLIEKIRTGSVLEREEASHRLKEMGKAAAPELEKVTQDPNPEVSGIAKKLLALLKLRDTLPAGLMKAVRGIEDRLAFGGDAEWTRAFLEAEAMNQEGGRLPLVKRRDLEPLAERALAAADTAELKSEVLDALVRRRLPAAGVVALLDDDELNTQAFDSLAQHPTEKGVARLIELMYHKEEDLRSFAVQSLEQLDARNAAADVEKLLNDLSSRVRSNAASAHAKFRGKEAIPALVRLLKDKDADVRHAAVEGLQGVYAKEEGKRIAELLRDPETQVRKAAAEALGHLNYKEGVPGLIGLFKDVDCRGMALKALRLLRAKEAAPEALKLLDEVGNLESHYLLIAYLAQEAPRESKERALALLKHEKWEVRMTAIYLLEKAGGAGSAPEFLKLLKEGEEEDRMAAAYVAGTLKIKEALPELMKLVKAYPHRAEPVTALARLDAREAIPILVPCLKISDVQRNAMEALGDLKAKEAAAEIAGFLASKEVSYRMYAIRALTKIEGREAIPRILPFLVDEEDDVSSQAMIELALLEAWDQAPKVAAYLEDRKDRVRAEAAGFLARAGSREGVAALLEEKEDAELWLLNAVRAPELWKRLQAIRVSGRRSGTALERVRQLAKEAKLEVEVVDSPVGDAERWLERESDVTDPASPQAAPFVDALWWELPLEYEIVLEWNKVRLIPWASALPFWKAWWKEGGPAAK